MATSTLTGTGNQAYTAARIDYLASYLQAQLPGLTHDAAVKWITAEKGVNGNVLGVTYTGNDGKQHLYTYSSQEAGLRAAASLIKSSSNYSGVRGSLPSGNTVAQLRALAASPWSGGGYYAATWKSIIGTVSGVTPSSGTSSSVPQGTLTGSLNGPLSVSELFKGQNTPLADPNHVLTVDDARQIAQYMDAAGYGTASKLLPDLTAFINAHPGTKAGSIDLMQLPSFGSGPASDAFNSLTAPLASIGDIGTAILDPENWKFFAALAVGVPLAFVGFYLLAGVQTGGQNA